MENDMKNSMILDVLKEIGNIGAGNAATALAKMIDKKVDMSVPKVNVLSFGEVPSILGGEENQVAGIFFKLTGDMTGTIMFVLSTQSASILMDFMMPGLGDDIKSEFAESALKEIGNILSGSYVSSLSGLTNLNIQISTPSLCVDMAGAILSVPAIEFGMLGDTVLIIQNDFFDNADNRNIEGYFFLIPDEESFVPLFNSLGISL